LSKFIESKSKLLDLENNLFRVKINFGDVEMSYVAFMIMRVD